MRRKILILSSDEPHHKYFIRAIASHFDLSGVVIEPGRCQRRRLLWSKKYHQFLWAEYHHLRRLLLGLNRYRTRFFCEQPHMAGQPIETLVAENINSKEVEEFIALRRPDVVLIIGVSVLMEKILSVVGPCILNIHGGYLPEYRGNHCIFFALYHGRYDRIGSTIHFVDRGIDTGDIVAHFVPEIGSTDEAEVLYCKAERMAIDGMVGLLKKWELGCPIPRSPQVGRGRLYNTRDRGPLHDLRMYCRLARNRLRRRDKPY